MRSNDSFSRWIAAVGITAVIVAAGLFAGRALGDLGPGSSERPQLGFQDDYALRHLPSAPQLGFQDDYALRHLPSASPTPTDD